VDARALLASLPSTLVIASVLTVNNTCDVAGDREAGRHTLSVLVGRRAGEALVYILGCSAFGLMLAMALVGAGGGRAAGSGGGTELVFPALPRIGLVIVPAGFVLAVVVWITMHLRGYGHDTKRQNMGSVVLVVLIYTITYGATFATSY
jgi:1,4-dihydroxy-2-naphthoate octaprenyltransferase